MVMSEDRICTYRKKPVEVKAVRWDGSNLDIIREFVDGRVKFTPSFTSESKSERLFIDTLEGQITAQIGDWIIRGVKREFYPCKDDIFRATYELVE
jgi:hypothetical protein